jgi:excisionase family DNA binding protein
MPQMPQKKRLMQLLTSYPEVYSVEEFAKLFKLSAAAVRNLILQGEILAIRIGKQHRIPQHVVDRYFAQALPPEERGFGMWKQKPVASLTYVNKLRDRDRRIPKAFLKDMAKDE